MASKYPRFEAIVDRFVAGLIGTTNVASAASATHRKAGEAPEGGLLGVVKRAFVAPEPPPPPGAAHDEVHDYARQLVRLYARLGPLGRGALAHEVDLVAGHLEQIRTKAEASLAQAAWAGHDNRRRTPADIGDDVRAAVAEHLERITPSAALAVAGRVPSSADSLLPPAARALAAGQARADAVVRNVEHRAESAWRVAIKQRGLDAMLPALRRLVGDDPIIVARLAGRLSQGVVVGTKLDPTTRGRKGEAVLDPDHTVLVLGASGIGKTTGIVAPIAALRAAAGDNVVVVTPQSPTIELVLGPAQALSGQARVPVIDFGGEIISADSPDFRTWDPTRKCLTEDGAVAFADAFAGPKLPARADLSNPEYWGGIISDLYAAAGMVTAGMRAVGGLDPSGLNGMARVYDLLRTPRPGDIPTELPSELREALKDSPDKLRAQETLFREAGEYAKRFNPRLQRIAFQEHLLRAQGLDLSHEVLGDKLESLSDVLNHVGKSNRGDPMESLIRTFMRAVPRHERLVMSPRPGQVEVDPQDLVRPGAGISFVAYAHTGSTGIAAGAFTSAVLDAAIRQNKDAHIMKSIGGEHAFARLALVVDEGGAGRYIPRLPEVVTDTRQIGISALLSMTSEHHLKEVFGEQGAGKFIHGPCVIDLSPGPEKAAAIAPLFGQHLVARTSSTAGPAGDSTTRTPHREYTLDPADIARLPRGVAVMQYPSDAGGDRVTLIGLPQFADPKTVVGAVAQHVRAHPERFEPVDTMLRRFRPDLSKREQLQRNPAAVMWPGDAASVEAALSDPAEPQRPVEPQPPAEPEPTEPPRPDDDEDPAFRL
jgi:hypothetical protein